MTPSESPTRQTTWLFCRGVDLQHMTDRQLTVTSRNTFCNSFCRAKSNVRPSITKVKPEMPESSWAIAKSRLDKFLSLETLISCCSSKSRASHASCEGKHTCTRYLHYIYIYKGNNNTLYYRPSTFYILKQSNHHLTLLSQLAVSNWSVARKSLQAHAMLMAVSCLSPVSTHTLIPALCKASMVSGTSSCNRSTIPVAPEDSQIVMTPEVKKIEEVTTI